MDADKPLRPEDVLSFEERFLKLGLENSFWTAPAAHLDSLEVLGFTGGEVLANAHYVAMDAVQWAIVLHDLDRQPTFSSYCALAEEFPPRRPLAREFYLAQRATPSLGRLMARVNATLEEEGGDITNIPETLLYVLGENYELGHESEYLEIAALLKHAPQLPLLNELESCSDDVSARQLYRATLLGADTLRTVAHKLQEEGAFEKYGRQLAAYAHATHIESGRRPKLLSIEKVELERIDALRDHANASQRPVLERLTLQDSSRQSRYVRALSQRFD